MIETSDMIEVIAVEAAACCCPDCDCDCDCPPDCC
jgi:hypothetical protein